MPDPDHVDDSELTARRLAPLRHEVTRERTGAPAWDELCERDRADAVAAISRVLTAACRAGGAADVRLTRHSQLGWRSSASGDVCDAEHECQNPCHTHDALVRRVVWVGTWEEVPDRH